MKKLLFFIILSAGWQAFAMEEKLVTLQSSDGQDFKIEAKKAKLSGTIKDLIQDAGIAHPIPLKDINSKTLAAIINLLGKLEPLVAQSKYDPYLYIPRAFQPMVNDEIKNLDMAINVFLAANYLAVPIFILNGAAAAVVDHLKINTTNAPEVLNNLLQKDRDKAKAAFNDKYKLNLSNIPYDLWKYIERHVAMRASDITEEYSLADYANYYEQVSNDDLDLGKLKLTSLFGISLVQDIENATYLNLSKNCFFDMNLDPQKPQNPFAGLKNLRTLNLKKNKITTLPSGWANGLEKLFWLELQDNQLSSLQPGWAEGLGCLTELHLNNNHITSLPPRWAHGLGNLQHLYLSKNQLKLLPAGWAESLSNLQFLWLNENELTTLQPGWAEGIGSLRLLHFESNLLSTLQSGWAKELGNLQTLSLGANKLTTLQSGWAEGLKSLDTLNLENNRITTMQLGWTKSLWRLRILDLSGNQLTTLKTGWAEGLGNLGTLVLESNQLTTLQAGWDRGLESLNKLKLWNNELNAQEKEKIRKDLPNVRIEF